MEGYNFVIASESLDTSNVVKELVAASVVKNLQQLDLNNKQRVHDVLHPKDGFL